MMNSTAARSAGLSNRADSSVLLDYYYYFLRSGSFCDVEFRSGALSAALSPLSAAARPPGVGVPAAPSVRPTTPLLRVPEAKAAPAADRRETSTEAHNADPLSLRTKQDELSSSSIR